jgi:hypothetical protein
MALWDDLAGSWTGNIVLGAAAVLVAIALLVVVTLASRLLLRQGAPADVLLRRVASRRRGRCELSPVSAMITLLHQEPALYDHPPRPLRRGRCCLSDNHEGIAPPPIPFDQPGEQ